MELEKAIKRRDYIKIYKYVDLDMLVYIAPKRDKNFDSFIECFFQDENKEDIAKDFSIDKQFRLCAISSNKDTIFRIFPDLDIKNY